MSEKKQIKVFVNGKPVLVRSGTLVSDILNIDKPCGGHGKCGKCRVKVNGRDALACQTHIFEECEIEAAHAEEKNNIVTDGDLPSFEIAPVFEKFGMAIDIGTTTIAARLYDTSGKMLSEYSCLNPQREWGADVISRIEAALGGKADRLSQAIRGMLDDITIELASIAQISAKDIDGAVVTGNTVMLSLLTGEDTEPFSHAPFKINRFFGDAVFAKELELSSLMPDTKIYFPPCISAFVGADTVCAILSTELCGEKTAMLADIGTNGEIAMWHNNRLSVCSTAAGPAFEGVGITMGMRGATGAIDKISVVNQRLYAHTIGEGSPVGICGSGLIDAVACMLDLEMLDESGYFEDDKLCVDGDVCLYPKDLRMVQLAKSAICAGILTLIQSENSNVSDVRKLYIAGGFGSYLNKASAARIGLIPKELSTKSISVGNAALSGATLLLLDKNAKALAESIAKNAKTVDLAANPVFSENYMMAMLLEEI